MESRVFKRFTAGIRLPRITRILWQARFKSRTVCISCKSRRLIVLRDKRWFCKRCRIKFSLLTRTPLEKSRLRLDEWYELLFWFVYGFTAHKTAKETGLPQRRVHRSFEIIRKAIVEYEQKMMTIFMGEVEVDETYVGAKFKNRRLKVRAKLRKVNAVKRGRGAKTLQQPVFGIYQRNGTVYVEFVSDVGTSTLQDIIKGRIALESSIYSDTMWSYYGLNWQGYQHETIDHGRNEYVATRKGRKIHINGIEGFWGYMKERLLKYHGVKRGNLIDYVKEIEFRFNHRKLSTDELMIKTTQILMKSAPSND